MSAPVRVVHIIDDLGLGGAQRQLLGLLKRIDRSRFEVQVISLSMVKTNYADAVRALGVPLTQVPQAGAFDLRCLRAVTALLKAARPAVVHTWLFTADLYGRLAAFRLGTPRVVCAVRNTIDDMPWHYRLVNRWLARRTACVTINAEAIRQGLVDAVGIPPQKIRLIRNGIDLAEFPAVEANGAYRQEWGVAPDAQVVAMIARFAPQKDHRTFIDAAHDVSQACPQAYFLLVGDGTLRPDIERQVAARGLTGRVRFLGARRDVWQLLHHVDLVALSSVHEGSSNVILEAMAAGRPVVATTVGGNAELVAQGATGWLVPPRNSQALGEAIIKILRDPARARAMGQAARRRVEEFFIMERTARDTEALYDDLLRSN